MLTTTCIDHAVQQLLQRVDDGHVSPIKSSQASKIDVRVAEQAAFALGCTDKGKACRALAEHFAKVKAATSYSRPNTAHPEPNMQELKGVVDDALHKIPQADRLVLAATPQNQETLEGELATQMVQSRRGMRLCISP
jgi:hypothetical protein